VHGRRAVALPPLPLTLPPPPCRRQASPDVALSRCRYRRSIRAAATALPPSRCAPPPRFALPPPPLTLPPPLCRRHDSADVALVRCRHCRRCAVALLPPPLTLPLLPRRRQAAANVALLPPRCRRHAVSETFGR
jgi:hypothetical protein